MKFGVVIVTYNRLDKLKIALNCYEKQKYLPIYMIVIDNASSDGTKEYLDNWGKNIGKIKKEVVHLKKNTGGSGGFYEGLKRSLKLPIDYVWVSDDDAYPDDDSFSIANDFLLKHDNNQISAVCGAVINRGKIDNIHRRLLVKGITNIYQIAIPNAYYKKEYFKFNLFTYVGTFISLKKLKEVGLPEKNYFIYCDDTEHSYRLSLVGSIYCIPNMRIIHDGPVVNSKDGVNWKLYYGIRNSIDFVRRSFPKRYYYAYKLYFRLKYYGLITLLYKNKIVGYKLVNNAIKDANMMILGLSEIYKPGWRPNEK